MFGMIPFLFKFSFAFFKELLDCMKREKRWIRIMF